MARTDDEVAEVLVSIYRDEFAGKARQRFLLTWADVRALYNIGRLTSSRFESLVEAAIGRGLHVLDLGEGEGGHLVAIVRKHTVGRWRRVPKRIIDQYRQPPNDENGADEDEADW